MGDRQGDCRVRSYKDLGAIESGAYYKILFQSTISMLRIHSFFSGEPLPPWFYFKVRDFLWIVGGRGYFMANLQFFYEGRFLWYTHPVFSLQTFLI